MGSTPAFTLVGMVNQLNDMIISKHRQDHEMQPVSPSDFMNQPVRSWTTATVGKWLDKVEFDHYKEVFLSNRVDGETLLNLDEKNITELVKSFHVKKLLRLISNLRMRQASHTDQTSDDQKSLEQRIEDLKSQIESAKICIMCIDEDKNIKFNCGHVCVCAKCSLRLSTCPLCRLPITAREKVFI